MAKKNVSRTRYVLSKLFYLGLLFYVVVGIGNRVGMQKYIRKDLLDNITLFVSAIFGGISIWLIILSRHDTQAMDQEEAEAWEVIRAKGKRQYIHNEIVKRLKTLLYIIPFVVFIELLAYYLNGETNLVNDLLLMLGLLAIFFVVVPLIVVDKQWHLNERGYEIFTRPTTQHNKVLDRSRRSAIL